MEDAKVEDEKNTGLSSSGYLESQKIVLPKDVFRNGFTWSCYETFKSLAFRIWLLSWLPVTTWWKMSSNWIYPFLATNLLILCVFFLPLIQMLCRKRTLSKQLTQFSKEIIANSPGTDVENWETIAANINSYMYVNKFWKTKYFFYGAWNCQEAFRLTILEPFSLKKDDDSKLKSFKDSVPYIEEALEVYFTEVDKQWKLFDTDKARNPVDLDEVQLPKETYRFKFTWVLKRIFTFQFLPWVLCFLDATYTTWYNPLLFRISYLGCTFLVSMQTFQNIRGKSMKMEHKMQYLSTITNEQEIGANGWDQVAKRMNRYLFRQKVWKNEEFFFDGIDCQRFFERNFVGLLSSKRVTYSGSLSVELWPYIREAQSSCTDESSA
ncbi:Cos9p SKDI_11G0030 [Saccharomyces kudriavzevii IFO 1802]|uniref:Uncharacterized protein n=2 Tax=Saccharomyces kudriavzevii (strain ATCC MYA-4449 / AS 2.2408 / CBS 8840 / NBRC 1802 / NCYC 2889) TaxID=226230 RepID=A0AA35J225_SACK1|nr:uncharacterized protein SKDI_11G0030 [Saccharomyces kudriavzevii IFO 1802]EJT44325.1 hypothetical protein SKUD_199402 [Saccharomyces kudriavzevii IFO 1802]CAI4044277.1 hypothetical protein SKDI_11G0030 [Saccharomyces kudriavzevii IFO 1802]